MRAQKIPLVFNIHEGYNSCSKIAEIDTHIMDPGIEVGHSKEERT